MEYYVGIDLHSNNNYIGILDGEGKKVYKKKNGNDLLEIIKCLLPFKELIKGIVVESTFNWYWLVDGLMDSDFRLHLANTTAMQQYSGLKYSDDTTDSFWLANMLRLNILPEGWYPKELRAVRDLSRKRIQLVQHRTAFLLSIKGMISNCTGIMRSRKDLKNLSSADIEEIFTNPHQVTSAQSLNEVVGFIRVQIEKIEKAVLEEVKLRPEFKKLLTVTGIGNILALTIMLETGDINRFAEVGDYSSYCRCVPSVRLSNGKKKGKGNSKSGNRYLAWAYMEAAHHMVIHCNLAKRWHQKKMSKGGCWIVATKALSAKISRACYYIMKDQRPYNPMKLF